MLLRRLFGDARPHRTGLRPFVAVCRRGMALSENRQTLVGPGDGDAEVFLRRTFPAGRPVVVLSKHSSAWETLFLPYYIDHRMGFVYKESLHWIPFLGWALKSMNMIAINRSNGAGAYVSFLKKGLRFVKNGWWVTLFPEGTRVAWGARARYKTGGARFAVAAKALVLPVAHDAGRLWPRNSIGKTSGTIHVTFGPVIDAGAADFETVNRELEDWIEGEIARMSGPDAGAAPVRNQSV